MTENQILFFEEQRFHQWWLVLLMLFINGLFAYGLYQQLYLGVPWGDNPMSDTGLIIGSTVLLTFAFVFFFVFKLQTQVTQEGIAVRFFPFHIKYKKYTWDEIAQCYIRKYSPLFEYGGWGLRIGLSGKNMAFNVSGNMGLQLVYTNGKKLLIGTQKPEELEMALLKLGKVKE